MLVIIRCSTINSEVARVETRLRCPRLDASMPRSANQIDDFATGRHDSDEVGGLELMVYSSEKSFHLSLLLELTLDALACIHCVVE